MEHQGPSIHDVFTVYKWWRATHNDLALHIILPLLVRATGVAEQCCRAGQALCLILDTLLIVKEQRCTAERMTSYGFREAWPGYYATPPLCIRFHLPPLAALPVQRVQGELGLLLVLRPVDQRARFDSKMRGTLLQLICADRTYKALFRHVKSSVADLQFLVAVRHVGALRPERDGFLQIGSETQERCIGID